MITVIGFLIIGAFVLTLASAAGKVPLWVAVLLLSLISLIQILPLR